VITKFGHWLIANGYVAHRFQPVFYWVAKKTSRRGRGRPAIELDKVALLQETYLSLRLRKTEIEITAVPGIVSWDTRYRWLADPKSSARQLPVSDKVDDVPKASLLAPLMGFVSPHIFRRDIAHCGFQN
jgi:hypothetical protein